MAQVPICLSAIFPENAVAKYFLSLCSKARNKKALAAGIQTNKYFNSDNPLHLQHHIGWDHLDNMASAYVGH